MIKQKLKPHDLLKHVKNHPMIKPYIEGGETLEYLAHLIPEGGYNTIPKLVGDGVIVTGDAAQFVNAIHREGSNMAMSSGKIAAETIMKAKETGDFSERSLDSYRTEIYDSFIGKDLKKYKDAAHTFEEYPQYFKEYVPMMNQAMNTFFTVDGTTKWDKQKKIMKKMTANRGKIGFAKDMYRAWKAVK